MSHFSDSGSSDSDEGIRFKTHNIRKDLVDQYQESPQPDREYLSCSKSQTNKKSHSRLENKHKSSDEKDSRKHKKLHSVDRNLLKVAYIMNKKSDKEKLYNERTTTHISGAALSSNLNTKGSCVDKSCPALPLERENKCKECYRDNRDDECTDILSLSNKSSEILGPAVPPHLKKKLENYVEQEPLKVGYNREIIGPALPPHLLNKSSNQSGNDELPCIMKNPQQNSIPIGPTLPPDLYPITDENDTGQNKRNSMNEQSFAGPALPPHLQSSVTVTSDQQVIGPMLPPHLRQKLLEGANNCMPRDEEMSDDECTYGPLPAGHTKLSQAHIALEERALQLKMDQLEPKQDENPVREDWMLTLPAAKAVNVGLGPRQFRSKPGPDLSDRSSWTDTPEDRERKKKGAVVEEVDLQKEAELRELGKRDKEQEAMAKKHKRKNKDSLLEMHQKKLKQEKQKEGQTERRPFSRELDLQVNRFDEAQKKAVLKKAQLLDSRFSQGQSKYL